MKTERLTMEEQEALRRELLEEDYAETREETMLRCDPAYAFEKLGGYEALEELNKVIEKVNSYGHQISLGDVL